MIKMRFEMGITEYLTAQFEYFIQHQDELVKQYDGKVLVIKDLQVVGAYDDHMKAYFEAVKQFELGTFMIQRCEPGPEAYTITLNSNALYA